MTVEMDGSGTAKDPHRISCVEQLQYVNQALDACYKLTSDIDAGNTNRREFTPIGDRQNPFTGTFDGNNCEIANLRIKQPVEIGVGLFSYIGGKGQVKNLGLRNSTIEARNYVGSIAGINFGKIESSYVQGGDVSGDERIGGLVGNNGGKIECSYTVEVGVSGLEFIGNLVGFNWGEIELSYKIKRNLSEEKGVSGLVSSNRESCFTVSSLNEPNIPGELDLIMSKKDHRILYEVETSTLFAQVNGEVYSSENVSPIEMQSLVDETKVVKMTDTFRLSVVSARQG